MNLLPSMFFLFFPLSIKASTCHKALDLLVQTKALTPTEAEYILKSQRDLDFNINPLLYKNLTTLPPVKRSFLKKDAIVSRVNDRGHLENVMITKVNNDNVHVVSQIHGSSSEEIVLKDNLYMPILPYRRVIDPRVLDQASIAFSVTYIKSINDREGTAILVSSKKPLPLNDLELRPRHWTDTSTKDFSVSISNEEASKLEEEYRSLREIYLQEKESKNFVETNNSLITKIQQLLSEQGIVTSFYWRPQEQRPYQFKLSLEELYTFLSKPLIIDNIASYENITYNLFMFKRFVENIKRFTRVVLKSFPRSFNRDLMTINGNLMINISPNKEVLVPLPKKAIKYLKPNEFLESSLSFSTRMAWNRIVYDDFIRLNQFLSECLFHMKEIENFNKTFKEQLKNKSVVTLDLKKIQKLVKNLVRFVREEYRNGRPQLSL